MTTYTVFEKLSEIGFINVLSVVLLIFIGVPIVCEGIKNWKKLLGKSNREIKDENIEQRLNDMNKKIDDEVQKLNKRIDDMHQKQGEYHTESINIRGGLADKQEELCAAIASVTELLNEMKIEQRDEKIQRMRWQILEVANYIRNKEDVNMEQLNNALDTYDDYEKVLQKYNLLNGQVDVSIQLIREKKLEIMHGDT